MKKFIFMSMMVMLGILSCSACSKKNQLPDPVTMVDASTPEVNTTPVVPVLVVSQENWSFTLPSHDWISGSDDSGPSALVINDSLKNLVAFMKEEFPGTMQDYALFAVRGMRGAGATLVSSSIVTVNGTNFVLVESNKGSVRVFQWLTVKDHFGYGLSCGGLDSDNSQRNICMGVINTLTIK